MKTKGKVAKKRSTGEGSYRKRECGDWQGRISLNYKSYSVYGKDRRECALKIQELKEKLNLGVDTSTPTLASWLNTWLSDYVAVNRKPSTVENYTSITNIHLIPELGRVRIDKITKNEVQRMIGRKIKAKLAARTVRLIHHVLRCSLNVAMSRKMIAANPAKGAILPRIEEVEMETISPAEVNHLQRADLFDAELLFPCFLLMMFTGLRRGEALALRWSDVDLDHCTLVVKRELVKIKGGTIFQSPKTKHSNRLIPFNETLKSILISHKERQDELIKKIKGYKRQDLIFARETGNHYYPDSLRKILHRILKKAGVGIVRVHDLRHTCATILMLAGVHPKVVQEILGHSNISVTLGTYSHTMPSMKKSAVDSFSKFISTSTQDENSDQNKDPNKDPEESSEVFLNSETEEPPENPKLH